MRCAWGTNTSGVIQQEEGGGGLEEEEEEDAVCVIMRAIAFRGGATNATKQNSRAV